MKFNLFFNFFLFCFCSNTNAQNMVYNGDFEEYKTLDIPTILGINKLSNYVNVWLPYITASPDYININSVNPNYILYTKPYSKSACIHNGIWLNLTDSINYKFDTFQYSVEGEYQKLKKKVLKDSIYTISFRSKSGINVPKHFYNKNVFSGFGISLMNTDLYQMGQFPPNKSFVLIDSINPVFNKWKLVIIDYKSTDTFNYLYFNMTNNLGFNKSIIDTILFRTLNYKEVRFWYFIDDVKLLPKWQYLRCSSDTSICKGDSITLSVISGTGPYTWIRLSEPSLVLSSAQSIIVSPLDTAIYQVMSPFDTTMIQVDIIPWRDSLSIEPIICNLCLKDTFKFTISNLVNWYDMSIKSYKEFTEAGTYWYKKKENYCIELRQPISIIKDTFQIKLQQDSVFSSCANSVILRPEVKSPNLIYFLKWNDVINSDTFIADHTGFYWCEVRANLCYDRDTINIKIIKCPDTIYLELPKAFTPNNDGYNDIMKIHYKGIKELSYFLIYNRWGQLIFSSKNLDFGWDGYYKDFLQNSEMYYYTIGAITIENKLLSKEGQFMLLK